MKIMDIYIWESVVLHHDVDGVQVFLPHWCQDHMASQPF